jgi:RNA recognition motif-containing protein
VLPPRQNRGNSRVLSLAALNRPGEYIYRRRRTFRREISDRFSLFPFLDQRAQSGLTSRFTPIAADTWSRTMAKRNIIYVGGIDNAVTEEILFAAFSPFGKLTRRPFFSIPSHSRHNTFYDRRGKDNSDSEGFRWK